MLSAVIPGPQSGTRNPENAGKCLRRIFLPGRRRGAGAMRCGFQRASFASPCPSGAPRWGIGGYPLFLCCAGRTQPYPNVGRRQVCLDPLLVHVGARTRQCGACLDTPQTSLGPRRGCDAPTWGIAAGWRPVDGTRRTSGQARPPFFGGGRGGRSRSAGGPALVGAGRGEASGAGGLLDDARTAGGVGVLQRAEALALAVGLHVAVALQCGDQHVAANSGDGVLEARDDLLQAQ